MRYFKLLSLGGLILFGLLLGAVRPCWALPPGALLYRTSSEGKMFGYSGDPLTVSEQGVLRGIYPGHVGIYVGQENGVHYVVEALAEGIVKKPAEQFVNTALGEKYLGAKIPRNLSAVQQAKVVALAKNLASQGYAYDFDFKKQKGAGSGNWTCVGLVEKIYESANLLNPNNLAGLEYNWSDYAINITPDGLDNYSPSNSQGDHFSADWEFSKIARRTDLLLPAPELIGYNLGYEQGGDRYIFLPYTQYLQEGLMELDTDIVVSSAFVDSELRGSVNNLSLLVRWSLINNPLSSLKTIAGQVSDKVLALAHRLFKGSGDNTDLDIWLTELAEDSAPGVMTLAKVGASINKNTQATEATKANETKGSQGATVTSNPSILATINEQLSQELAAAINFPSSGINASWQAPDSKIDTTLGSFVDNAVYTAGEKEGPALEGLATINLIYSTAGNQLVELYNPSSYDLDLAQAGYRLERTKTAEDPGIAIRIGNEADGRYPGGTVIGAHSTYLIVKEGASDYFLSRADAIASRQEFAWTGNGYTLYLGKGAISSSQDPDIVEAVGLGAKASYYQGQAPAQEIPDNYLLKRIASTGNNNLDFSLVRSPDPNINWGGEKIEDPPPEVKPPVVEINNQDEGDPSLVDEEDLEPEPDPSEVDDDPEEEAAGSQAYAVISRVYKTGNNRFIELYNPSEEDLDLRAANYRLHKTYQSATPSILVRLGEEADLVYTTGEAIIRAGDYFMLVAAGSDDYYLEQADAIVERDFTWTNDQQTFFLGQGPISSPTDEDILEVLGFGTASYWGGEAPAPALAKNYYLQRVGYSGHNNQDFILVPSDDPSLDWRELDGELLVLDSSSNFRYQFYTQDYDLYPDPEPVVSESLRYLWHLDDGEGELISPASGDSELSAWGAWLPGKFGNAKFNGYQVGGFQGQLVEPVNANNFSLSFWYRKGGDKYSRLEFSLLGDDTQISLEITNDLLVIGGLSSPVSRQGLDFPFDEEWRQFMLVVNREGGYWGIYVDGQLIYGVETIKLMGNFNYLNFGGNNFDYGLDELAIWDRSLSAAEVLALREAEQPLAPLSPRPSQAKAVMKYFWDFNGGLGQTGLDLVQGAVLELSEYQWQNTGSNEAHLSLSYPAQVGADLELADLLDFSLSFRWRVPGPDKDNRVAITLGNEERESVIRLTTSQTRPSFQVENIGANLNLLPEAAQYRDDDWHSLVLAYDSYRQQVFYYLDGQLAGWAQAPRAWRQLSLSQLKIYAENWGTDLDDLAIWQGTLSLRQAQRIAQQP